MSCAFIIHAKKLNILISTTILWNGLMNKEKFSSKDYTEPDCLGMVTPLHIVACSGTHGINFYRQIVDDCPDAMISTDIWGETPLGYAMLSRAPNDVIHYFFEMHKQKWGELPFDFGKKIKILALCKSAEFIRQIIQAQRTYFSELVVNWQEIVDEFMIFNKYKSVFQKIPISMFRVLAEASAFSLPVCVNLEDQQKIDDWIDRLMLIHAYHTEHLSRKQLLSFMDRLEIVMEDESSLDYDRLMGYSEKSHIALLKKC